MIYSVLSLVSGLIIGSFLNCLIWRIYKDESLSGRSYCPKCRQQIAWYDNIPVLSFLWLRGRCRRCGEKISWQYPLVEIMTAMLFYLTFRADMSAPDFSLRLLRDWLLVVTMVVVFVYDFRWQLVPMILVWPMSAFIFVLNLFLGNPLLNLFLFAALGGIFFLAQYLLTQKRGVGEGDIWLGVLLGLAFPAGGSLLLIMLISYGIGATVGLILVSRQKKNLKSQIALGPFLALGAIITLIWGQGIISWYLGLFS